jgi:2-C-methyl-D-erythritol 2,4-cyclodiphosphate synthase
MDMTPYRIGFGYDIHQLAPGKGLTLGGVKIKSNIRLVGHSDADVLLHAICDALLGALALGDIGKHFPNTDPKYRGISSMKLLEATRKLIVKEGYAVVNVDASVVLERPKIGKATIKMQSRIGKTLGIPASAVSVKATTNESLGPIGRGEGCAAMAVALIEKDERKKTVHRGDATARPWYMNQVLP